jgi:hypothetical protein
MNGLTGGNRGRRRAGALAVVAATALPGAVIREVLIPSSYTVADVAPSIRQDTRRRDRGTGQLEAGS